MNFKKIMLIALLVIILIVSFGFLFLLDKEAKQEKEEGKLNVVVTTFSTYDFVKQVAGDKVNLKLLLDPGVDAHSYEPTASDIINIQESDLFIYIGGEMENWTDKVLGSLEIKDKKIVCIADYVDKMTEEEVDGAEAEEEEELEEGAYDEHIWTSPNNAIKMVEEISNVLSSLDKGNENLYTKNSNDYIQKIKDVQAKIKEIVDNKVRDRLVFGDKMPMQYFINEFGLKVSAAFSGCSTETEPSSATIAYLVNVVKKENIPVVLYIELNSGKVAQTIASESGAKAMQIQSFHNISKEDFLNGETYVDLMNRNFNVLKAALQ